MAIIVFAMLTSCSLPGPPTSKIEAFAPTPAVTLLNPRDLVTVLPRDAIPAITDPQFDSVGTAQSYMNADEQVIGLAIHGEVRAYPINILSRHEIANDVVGGEPIAITWCPLCYSALVFSRRANGDELTFGVSGKLYQNNLIMYDHQTDSLWSQLLGQAVAGPLSGTHLRLIVASQSTWEDWRAEHPDTLVLSKPKTLKVFLGTADVKDPMYNYSVDRYRSYYASRDRGIVNRNIPEDTEASVKERVLGLRIGDEAKAYFFRDLAQVGVVNDTLAGQPILITFDLKSENGAGFDRRLNGQVLTFSATKSGGNLALQDQQTDSRWNGLTGRAVSGPLAGQQLRRLPTTYAFWFAWKAHFPETQIYQHGALPTRTP
jgi:hypothetical protein